MFIVFDYRCTNSECDKYDVVEEILHKKEEEQFCSSCKQLLKKMPCAPRNTHISWSTWRM